MTSPFFQIHRLCQIYAVSWKLHTLGADTAPTNSFLQDCARAETDLMTFFCLLWACNFSWHLLGHGLSCLSCMRIYGSERREQIGGILAAAQGLHFAIIAPGYRETCNEQQQSR